MGFVLTEDQELIRKSARSFVQQHLPIPQLRKLRDTRDPVGFSRDAWKALAANGLVGIALPEEYGGGGLGLAELGLVLEECGRTLAATPFISTVLLSANALVLAGSDAQKAEHLPAIARGERIIAFAHDEGTRFNGIGKLQTVATTTSNAFRVAGAKAFVLDGHGADQLIVSARLTSGDPGLFLVPANAPGVSVKPLSTVDSRNVANIDFVDVEVPASAHLPGSKDVLDRVLDRATAGLCAEMLGSAQEVFDITVAYLKVRKQFGVAIGSFQALKHRAAQMFCELELSKSIVLDALRALDADRPDGSSVVSAAKSRLNDTFVLAASEGIQMHGGIGATDELDIGFFYKRAKVAEAMLGSSAYHRDRFAQLSGY